LQDGTVWAWGRNDYYGQLGNGNPYIPFAQYSPVPVCVGGNDGKQVNVKFIAAGGTPDLEGYSMACG
jgi:alpha-tubulin suppressor-like RCC1 family protein